MNKSVNKEKLDKKIGEKHLMLDHKIPTQNLCENCGSPRGDFRKYCKTCNNIVPRVKKAVDSFMKDSDISKQVKSLIEENVLKTSQIEQAFARIQELSDRIENLG